MDVCVKNPYASGKFTADLNEFITLSPSLSLEIGRRLKKHPRGQPLASYGKACVAGVAGEYERTATHS